MVEGATLPLGGDSSAKRRFDEYAAELPEHMKRLCKAESKPRHAFKTIPTAPGVYVFSDGNQPKYVGQARNLKKRQHMIPSSKENQASFAFRLALEELEETVDRLNSDLRARGYQRLTRKDIEAIEQFQEKFLDAKRRVGDMNVQFTEVDDPITRTLLEVYVSMALGTERYNSFETH